MKNIYFANGLFSEQELTYNAEVVRKLRLEMRQRSLDVNIYLPQENEAINDKSGYADSIMIFNGDNEHLDNSDLVIAMIDGPTIDNGVACEIGRATAKGIPVIGVYTDSRQGSYGNNSKINAIEEIAESQFAYVNLYVIGAIKSNGEVITSTKNIADTVVKYIG